MSNIENENTYKKFQEVPASTSTPNNLVLTSRKSIHTNNSVSPITLASGYNAIPRRLSKERVEENKERAKSEMHLDSTKSEDTSSDNEDDSAKRYSYESSKSYSHGSVYISNQKFPTPKPIARDGSKIIIEPRVYNFNIIYGCLTALIAAVILSVILSKNTVETATTVTIKDLQDYFPLQSEETWTALQSGVDEVKQFNKPSVFLLLYEDEAEETLNHMLNKISKYATCILNENCAVQPIVLTSTILGTEKAINDYGYVIEKYKPELEKKAVMIVKNLDRVPGEVAQAFHSMCDEYTPLVKKTVFFFTIRIKNLKILNKRNLEIVEELLKNNWSNLNDDIFYPLFTRISNMVLTVVPEKI